MARRGFRLGELLAAVGVLALILGGIIAFGAGLGARTPPILRRVQAALASYQAEFGAYPPDGHDPEPGWVHDQDGVRVGHPPRGVKGTASLLYFLGRPLIKETMAPARGTQRKMVGPFLSVEARETTHDRFDPNHPWTDHAYWVGQGHTRAEILDPWGRPLRYDKTPGGYELWSCGPSEEDGSDDIRVSR